MPEQFPGSPRSVAPTSWHVWESWSRRCEMLFKQPAMFHLQPTEQATLRTQIYKEYNAATASFVMKRLTASKPKPSHKDPCGVLISSIDVIMSRSLLWPYAARASICLVHKPQKLPCSRKNLAAKASLRVERSWYPRRWGHWSRNKNRI